MNKRWIRLGTLIGASGLLVLLLFRRSSDPVLFGRYSLTFVFFWLTFAVFLRTLWRVCLNREGYERLVSRLPAMVAVGAVTLMAGIGFVLRWNFLTPILVLVLAVVVTVFSDEAPRLRFRNMVKGFGLAAFSLLMTVGMMELALKIVRPEPFAAEQLMYFTADPYVGYKYKPNSEGEYQKGIPAKANRHGHRDDDVSFEKPDDVFRILMLGDSFTVGYNVEQKEAYPEILEKLLNASSGRKVEVVNAGVSGWCPFQYAEYFAREGHRFEPDLVLLGLFVGNDSYDPTARVEDCRTALMGKRVNRKSLKNVGWARLRIFAYNRFHLARLLMNRGRLVEDQATKDFVRKTCDDFTPFLITVTKARMDNFLALSEERKKKAENTVFQMSRIKSKCDEAEVPFQVVFIPDEVQVNDVLKNRVITEDEAAKYDFDMPQKYFAEQFEEMGIGTIRLLEIFRGREECLYMNDAHWLPAAHALAGELIAEAIEELISKE